MKNSTIGVYLSEEELLIIQGWIEHVRNSSSKRELTEQENPLVEKFNQHLNFIKEINS